MHLIDKVQNVEVNTNQIEEFLPSIYEKLEGLDREELIQKFVSLEFNNFLSYYENAADLNDLSSSRGDTGKGRPRDENMTRFFINLGRKDDLNPARLIGLINEQRITDNIEIGAIDILDTFSFFEIDKNFGEAALEAFAANDPEFNGRGVNIEITKKERSGGGRGRGGDSRRKRRSSGGGNNSGGFGRRRSSEGGSSKRSGGGAGHRGRRSNEKPDRASRDKKTGGFGRRRRER